MAPIGEYLDRSASPVGYSSTAEQAVELQSCRLDKRLMPAVEAGLLDCSGKITKTAREAICRTVDSVQCHLPMTPLDYQYPLAGDKSPDLFMDGGYIYMPRLAYTGLIIIHSEGLADVYEQARKIVDKEQDSRISVTEGRGFSLRSLIRRRDSGSDGWVVKAIKDLPSLMLDRLGLEDGESVSSVFIDYPSGYSTKLTFGIPGDFSDKFREMAHESLGVSIPGHSIYGDRVPWLLVQLARSSGSRDGFSKEAAGFLQELTAVMDKVEMRQIHEIPFLWDIFGNDKEIDSRPSEVLYGELLEGFFQRSARVFSKEDNILDELYSLHGSVLQALERAENSAIGGEGGVGDVDKIEYLQSLHKECVNSGPTLDEVRRIKQMLRKCI